MYGIAMEQIDKGDIVKVDIDATNGNARLYKLKPEQPKTERQIVCDEILEDYLAEMEAIILKIKSK